jgi:hypothetical protein
MSGIGEFLSAPHLRRALRHERTAVAATADLSDIPSQDLGITTVSLLAAPLPAPQDALSGSEGRRRLHGAQGLFPCVRG